MEDLKSYLKKTKEALLKKRDDQNFINRNIKEVLEKNFDYNLVSKYIKSFQLKKSTLIIETTSKVFAQELFWKKEDLKNKINLQKRLVKDIVIR